MVAAVARFLGFKRSTGSEVRIYMGEKYITTNTSMDNVIASRYPAPGTANYISVPRREWSKLPKGSL